MSLLVLLVLLFRLFIKKIVSVPLIYSQKTRPTLFYYFFTLFEAVILVIPLETLVIEKRIQTTSSFWLLYLNVYVVTYSECNFCHSSSTLSQQSSTSNSMLEDIVNLFIYLFSIKYSLFLFSCFLNNTIILLMLPEIYNGKNNISKLVSQKCYVATTGENINILLGSPLC